MLRNSLLFKVVAMMLAVTVIPFFFFNLISYRSTSNLVEERVIEMNQKLMAVGMNNVIHYFDQLNHLPVPWYIDKNMENDLRSSEPSFEQSNNIENQVQLTLTALPEIKKARFVSSMSGKEYVRQDQTTLGFSAIDHESELNFNEAFPDFSAKIVEDQPFLLIHKVLTDFPKPTHLGELTLYVAFSEFKRIHQSLLTRSNEGIFLFFGKDQFPLYAYYEKPVDHVNMKLLSKLSNQTQTSGFAETNIIDHDKGIVVYTKSDFKGIPLTMAKFIPINNITEIAKKSLYKTLFVQFLTFLLIIIASLIFTYSIVTPIKRLIRNINNIQYGNFKLQRGKPRSDELGFLEGRFHNMADRLNEMINQDYRQRIELSTAQIKMLQAQINPHFLYNTLQFISTLALRHQVPEIHERITELGSILRYSFDMGTEEVSLSMEIDHLNDYFSIQASRFKNKLHYSINCDAACQSIIIPKLILQPLVENSIIHGIEQGKGIGTIEVTARRKDHTLYIEVADNGRGLDDATMQNLSALFYSEDLYQRKHHSIGLLNVLFRLRLKYGERFEWIIHSSPYERTAIQLSISLEEEEWNEGFDRR